MPDRRHLGLALLAALLCIAVVPSRSSAATNITNTYSSKIYIDSGSSSPTLKGAYLSYDISNSSAQSDVWVKIDSFAGGVVTLAPNAPSLIHVGPMSAGATRTVFFFVQASAATTTAQTHTIHVYQGKPGGGGVELSSANQSITVGDTNFASANKVTSVSISSNTPSLGGVFTITVEGETGVTNSGGSPPAPRIFYFSPEAEQTFPANVFQLTSTQITFNESGCPNVTKNCGSFTNKLNIPEASMPDMANTPYTAVYSFRAIGTTATSTSVSPVGYLTSGGPIKHTNTSSFSSLPPIAPVVNTLAMAQTASPTSIGSDDSHTVTYTSTISSTSAASVNVDDFVDTLPVGAAYVAGSSTYGGAAIADPNVSGQTLTWAALFAVPANGSRSLVFQTTVPSTAGTYTNSVISHLITTQVDSTIDTSDNAPATSSVTVSEASAPTPPTVTIDTYPDISTTSIEASFTYHADEQPSTFTCSLDGNPVSDCDGETSFSGLTVGQHVFSVTARDGVGNDSTPAEYSWTITDGSPPPPPPPPPRDTTPPNVSIDSHPSLSTTDTTGSFTYHADEPATLTCLLDGNPVDDCDGDTSFSDLTLGEHTFTLRAVDAADNDSGPVSFTWTITDGSPPADTLPPSVSIDSHPDASTSSTSATFTFSADEPATFTCSLDNGPYLDCLSAKSYSDLGVSEHTFRVKGKDAADNESTPATYTWTVSAPTPPPPADTTPPTVTIDAHPNTSTTDTTGTFAFSANETSTFLCSLDGATYIDCSSPKSYTGLAVGAHTFLVKSRDDAGNASDPVSFTWTVAAPASEPPPSPTDTTPPVSPPPPPATPGTGPLLTITANVSKTLVSIGEPTTMTMIVRNVGDADATHVVVVITLPNNTRLRSVALGELRALAMASGNSCTARGQVVTCQLGTMPPSKERVITLIVSATKTGSIVSNVALTADGISRSKTVQVRQRAVAPKPKMKIVAPGDVLFAFNSCTVSPRGRAFLISLRPLVARAKAINVAGFTDAFGSAGYNYRLSRCRAHAAERILLAGLKHHGRVRVAGYGESHPVASNATAYRRSRNRRVEITLTFVH